MPNQKATIITIILVALGGVSLSACRTPASAPTSLDATRTSSDSYLAYQRGDCLTVQKLTDPAGLRVWAHDEMRHSTLLLQGFCREIEGDIQGAREIYRQLAREAPGSFASDDAAERTRILKIIEKDPDYLQWVDDARERAHSDKPRRTPVDRIPVEFPPLAKAIGIDGYAIVEFEITRRGNTENPVVVESDPPLLFDGAVLRAVRRWQYEREPSTSEPDRQLIRILFRPDGWQGANDQGAMGIP